MPQGAGRRRLEYRALWVAARKHAAAELRRAQLAEQEMMTSGMAKTIEREVDAEVVGDG